MNDIVLNFVIGLAVGWIAVKLLNLLIAGWIATRVIKELRTEVVEQTLESQRRSISVTIEKMNGQFYVYSKHDDAFLAQGVTAEEVQTRLNERFPGFAILAENRNLQQVGFVFKNSGVDNPPESV
jgi:hypothetical protein